MLNRFSDVVTVQLRKDQKGVMLVVDVTIAECKLSRLLWYTESVVAFPRNSS